MGSGGGRLGRTLTDRSAEFPARRKERPRARAAGNGANQQPGARLLPGDLKRALYVRQGCLTLHSWTATDSRLRD